MFPVSILLPFDQLVFEAVDVEHEGLTLTATSAVHATACPVCQSLSQRIHSRYTRTIADLPTAGRACTLLLRVRRFFCDVPNCPRKIFAERFGAELPAFARRTLRFTARLVDLAYAAGGHGGRASHTVSRCLRASVPCCACCMHNRRQHFQHRRRLALMIGPGKRAYLWHALG